MSLTGEEKKYFRFLNSSTSNQWWLKKLGDCHEFTRIYLDNSQGHWYRVISIIKAQFLACKRAPSRFFFSLSSLLWFWMHAGNIIASGDKTTHALFIEQCYFQRGRVKGRRRRRRRRRRKQPGVYQLSSSSSSSSRSIINDFDWIVLSEWLIFIFVIEQQLTFVIVVWLFIIIIDHQRFIYYYCRGEKRRRRDSTQRDPCCSRLFFLFEDSV